MAPVTRDAAPPAVAVRAPEVADGSSLWRLARDSRVLDVNTSYAYLLWCRDFAATSAVAEVDGERAGFVTGYLRPDRPDTLMVWQVAVDESHRGLGIARRLLDTVADRCASSYLETTIEPGNTASIALFTAFARGRDAGVDRETLFDGGAFPDGHEPEVLFRIGPLGPR
ncbi:MAG: diaminobutyrate acetyltransferase [Marmoricola sp.]